MTPTARPLRAARTYPVRVLGTGAHSPAVEVASLGLDARHGRPPGTTLARSGVASRRWAGPEETSSGMAASAVRGALDAAGLDAADLDAVVVAMVLPEQPMPSTAVLVLRALGVEGGRAEAFDVNASCLGFLTAFQTATLGIAAGHWDRVAAVATEIASKGLDHRSVESSALFGDGAAAVVLGRTAPDEISSVRGMRLATWPDGAGLCRIDAGGTRWNPVTPPPDPTAYLFSMDGRGILQHAAGELPGFLRSFLADCSLAPEAVDVVVPHQASGVGLRFLRQHLGFGADRVVDILADHGNQVSASLPTALHAGVASGRIARGDTVLLLGTGAGLTLGAVLLTF